MPHFPAISSHSLGRAFVHDLPSKLDQAAEAGLDIELFFEDLDYLAKSLRHIPSTERLTEAARIVRSLCDERDMSIVCLQPFMHYEGLRNRQFHIERTADFTNWVQLAKILRTDIISVPSTFLPQSEVSGDLDLIVQDLQEIADVAASAGVHIAYEALAWGTYVNTWEQAWNIVEKVGRWNFGICLDTFNIAARVFADPTAPSRTTKHADELMHESLQRLKKIDRSKILYVQVVDAEYLDNPLVKGHIYYDPGQDARMSWSRNCRLFYGEQKLGAYLPVDKILKVIFQDIGFEGYLSAELFNSSMAESRVAVPREHASRAAASFRKLAGNFHVQFDRSRKTRQLTTARKEDCSRAHL